MNDDVLLSRAYLNRVAEPANIPLWDLVRTVGPVEAAERVRTADVSADVRAATSARARDVDPYADLDAAARRGVRLVVPESDDWPHFAFGALERTGSLRVDQFTRGQRRHEDHGEPIPPLALWVRGNGQLSSVGVRSIGIVGSRAATAYGLQVSTDIAYGLGRRGFTVISGGAFGIDAAAHRGALTADATTVVISAGGPDTAYPGAHRLLFDRIAETGLVIAETPPGTAPQRRRFLTRNRLVAALATGTVVVEASRRSGAINTAGHCTRLDRPLMIVPGPITSAMSAGCHDLLRDQSKTAILVTGIEDVLTIVGASSDMSVIVRTEEVTIGGRVETILDAVDSRSRQVYDGFPSRRVTSAHDLAIVTGLSIQDVLRSLPVLELSGLVEEAPDGFRRTFASRPAMS